MDELFSAFLDEPNQAHYLALRRAVVLSDEYDPYSGELDVMEKLLDDQRHEEVLAKGTAIVRTYLLSPRLHHMMRMAAEALGDERRAEAEKAICGLCFKGIIETGDGSPERPFLVTTTEDEYDLLGFLDKNPTSQALVEAKERRCDRFSCSDGTELWFDVTDQMKALDRKLTRAH